MDRLRGYCQTLMITPAESILLASVAMRTPFDPPWLAPDAKKPAPRKRETGLSVCRKKGLSP
jgi:hypothetical protein